MASEEGASFTSFSEVEHDREKEREEEGDDKKLWLLARITTVDNRPFPVGSFTEHTVRSFLWETIRIEPITVLISSDRDCLLEFETGKSVVEIAMAIHGIKSFDGYRADVSTLMHTKSKCVEIVEERRAKIELAAESEKEKEQIRVEKEKVGKEITKMLEELKVQIAGIDELIERKVEVALQRKESGPTPPGSIKTPQTSETLIMNPIIPHPSSKNVGQINLGPMIPPFSGEIPTPKEEATASQWLYSVEAAMDAYSEITVRQALLSSVRGPARDLVEFYGFKADLREVIKAIRARFGKEPTVEAQEREFANIRQGKNESVYLFAGRLEQKFRKLQKLAPDEFPQTKLKRRLYDGLLPHLHRAVRYLYSKEISYDEFMDRIRDVEREENELPSLKAASVNDENSEQLRKLSSKIDEFVTSVRVNYAEKPEYSGKSKKTQPEKVKEESNTEGTSKRSPQKEVRRCYKCGGVGHLIKDCPNQKNVPWRQLLGELSPGPTQNKANPENQKQQ